MEEVPPLAVPINYIRTPERAFACVRVAEVQRRSSATYVAVAHACACSIEKHFGRAIFSRLH